MKCPDGPFCSQKMHEPLPRTGGEDGGIGGDWWLKGHRISFRCNENVLNLILIINAQLCESYTLNG